MKSSLFITAAVLSIGSSAAFTTPSCGGNVRPSSTSLSMAKSNDSGKTFAASAIAAAYILTGVVSADAALAMDGPSSAVPSFTDSSSVILAGRSGGRAGGRAAPRAMPRSQPQVINKRTTVIQAPPVVVGGGGFGYGGGYGYGYDPTPGLVFGAVNAIGNGMRESRQNQMIMDERAELSASREREAQMAARLQQLEMMQMQQSGQNQAQPQVIIAQPQVAPAQQ